MKKLTSNILLLTAAMIWGCAFVAQRAGMAYVGPWTFTCLRSLIGGITLLILSPVFRKSGIAGQNADTQTLWKGGLLCGLVLTCASMSQQAGIQYTTAGKAGFITALYVIIVPLFSIIIGKKVSSRIWIPVFLALTGFWLMSIREGFTLGKGDGLVLISALLYAVHILVIDHFSPLVNGVSMSCIQFFVTGILCFVPMLVFEHPQISSIMAAAVPILYAGVLSSGIAYTFQILGQRGAEPAVATLLLSLESVFSLLAGFLLLHEQLAVRELIGCVLVFAAILLAQMPEKEK